jgi:UDP-N-acetylmuramate dehydrogenase
MTPLSVAANVPLATRTTFELGGAARWLVEATDATEVSRALAWADEKGARVLVLGGGSNVVVRDEGFDGLVIAMRSQGVRYETRSGRVEVEVAAGESWDRIVEATVARGLAGIECLAGIPGSTGATPIQNVGAYGQEVSETLRAVRVIDRETHAIRSLDRDACELTYRDSYLKRHPDRFVVLDVTFSLEPGGRPAVRYGELERALEGGTPADRGGAPTVASVRKAVLRLRAAKSMVLDPTDPNRRSAGSFFTNPIVSDDVAERVIARAVADHLVSAADEVPRFDASPGRTKLAAGWLIERAGFTKGLRRGAVGLSSKHALALVHHGGGTTRELLALAREIQDGVAARFGVDLVLEPVIV